MSQIATFEEIAAIKNNRDVLLIDVREPSELEQTGTIPGSINIPLGDIGDVLKDMSAAAFKKRYGRDKPAHDTPIIFSCKTGGRSAQAMNIAAKLGFKFLKNYDGGWMDYAAHCK